MDAVLAVHAGLAGRPVEALTTLTCACAVHPVQADPISEAGVLGLPGAWLALGAKEACTAFSCLKQKDKAEPARFHLLVSSSCSVDIPLVGLAVSP